MTELPRPARRPSDAPTPVLIFDVNETLLDIESLTHHFERMFGDGGMLRTWFGNLVMYSMTLTLSGHYVDFSTLGGAVMNMLAETHGVDIGDDDLDALSKSLRTLPAHPDVAPGLTRLREAGYRLVTLTNSPHRPDSPSPLDNAGLGGFVERQFTVDSAGMFKPSTLLYRRVAADLNVHPSDCTMVAAHAWDTIGAQGAGMHGALITRPGNAALVAPGVPCPTIVATDITDLAVALTGGNAPERSV